MRIASVGQAVFAATLIAIGILGVVKGDFTPVWAGVPKGMPARELLAYLCTLISLACGVGLLWRRASSSAARVLLAYLLLWIVLINGHEALPAPTVLGAWYPFAQTAVIVAAAWILYAWFAADWDKRWLSFATGGKGVRIARVLYSLTLVFFGVSHFIYLSNTTSLVPHWLPAHVFWAYFFGATYIAAGVAILIGVFARLAAALSAIQMGIFTLLVWVPFVVAGHISANNWSEFVVSWTLVAGGWVVADSYCGIPWFAINKR
ncbi:MAG: DoxX family protein [Gammaproteobacteria bacterium]